MKAAKFSLKRLFHYLVYLFRGVQVFSLVGKSGTGKSFRAHLVGQKHGIDLIIDDGLLIRGQRILAGHSAKREKAILAAIRTALFTDPAHAAEVQQALEREKFRRILIIGTSIGMVRRIARVLALPPPTRIIRIEEIASQEEIAEASRVRDTQGKHIIPVPSLEVRRNYPQIFFDTVRILLRKKLRPRKKGAFIEKTVVRPAYGRRGRVTIAKTALTQMVLHCVQEFDPSLKVEKVIISMDRSEYGLEVIVSVPYGSQIAASLHQLQSYILKSIEDFTGLILRHVDVTVGTVQRR